jgi:hypothetical protein
MTWPITNKEDFRDIKMGRQKQDKVEYFPHYCRHSKSLKRIDSLFKNEGYSLWFRLLEILGDTDGHTINLNNQNELEYILDYTHLDKEQFYHIITKMVDLEMFDPDHYKLGVLWCDNYILGLKSIYTYRRRTLPKKPMIISKNENGENHIRIVFDPDNQEAQSNYNVIQCNTSTSNCNTMRGECNTPTSDCNTMSGECNTMPKKEREESKESKERQPAPPVGAPILQKWKKNVVLKHKTIPDYFVNGIIGRCNGDVFEAGRILYRAKESADPMSYITAGFNKGFILKPCADENTNSPMVKKWIEENFLGV